MQNMYRDVFHKTYQCFMEKIRMFYGKIRINIRKILLNSNDSELEDESWQ